MKYYNLLSKKVTEINQKKLSSSDINKKHIIICNVDELKKINSLYKFDKSSFVETDNIDETVRYTDYGSYHFISILFTNLSEKQNELNIYFSDKFLILCEINDRVDEVSKMITFVQDKINLAFDKNTEAEKILYQSLYNIFDSFILLSNRTMEKFEDKLEELQDSVLESINPKQIGIINRSRRFAYHLKKEFRALQNIAFFNDNTQHFEYINKYFKHFKRIEKRISTLISFSESLYTLTGEIMKIYDSKINNKTNLLITRLTVITVIMGIWTVVTGFFGMNFDSTGFHNPWYFLVAVGAMAILSIIVIIILKIKKII